jgi:biotin transport system substrate-specific component
MTGRPATIADRLWPQSASRLPIRPVALAFAGALALTVSAKLQVPFYPVPMTLQTLVVLLLGAAYGAPLAVGAVALYLAEGLAGLPVFAGAVAGPAYIAGPTGGFLVGFAAAAALVGALVSRGWARNALGLVAVMTLGHLVIFACGWSWLAVIVGPARAFALGVAPFYAATLVKTGLAAALTGAAGRLVRR